MFSKKLHGVMDVGGVHLCFAYARRRRDAIAQRIEPKASWGNLVLPEAQVAMLKQIADQMRQYRKVYCDWGLG